MPDRNDELLALSQQHATQQAAQNIADDARAYEDAWRKAVQVGDTANASRYLEGYLDCVTRANALAGMAGQQQRQAPAQQQPQQYFSDVELNILREFPGFASDPKKMAEAKGVADALVAKHVQGAAARGEAPDPNYRNSAAYDSALRIGIGLTASDGISPGQEIASEDAAIEATRGSKYAKDFDRRQYNAYAQFRDAQKARGNYPMDQTS